MPERVDASGGRPRFRPGSISRITQLTSWVLAPTLLWQIIKFMAVGPTEYWRLARIFGQLFLHAGSGLGAGYGINNGAVAQIRLLIQLVPWFVLVLLIATLLLRLSVPALRITRDRHAERVDEGAWRAGVALARSGLTIVVWWVFISTGSFVRHGVPGVLLLLPLTSAHALRWFDLQATPRLSRLLGLCGATCLVAGVVAGSAAHAVTAWRTPGTTVAEQRSFAMELARRDPGRKIGWSAYPRWNWEASNT